MSVSSRRLATFAVLAAAALAVSGCGLFGGGKKEERHSVKVTPDTTPPTKAVLKTVPGGLLPDRENARHSE